MPRFLCAFLLGCGASAHAYDQHPPDGVVVPPYERPVKRPMVQAALVVQGTVQSIHLQPSTVVPVATMTWQDGEWKPAGNEGLPLTETFKAYVAERFAGYSDPEWTGRWAFQMVRLKVDTVIASEPGVEVKAGDVIDLYVPSDFAIRSPKLVAFAERYVREQEGSVSPWSEAGKAFVLQQLDVSSTLIYEASKVYGCPGAALTRGGYVLRIAPTKEDLAELAAKAGGMSPDGDSVSQPHLDGTEGGLAEVPAFKLSGTPWSCDDLLAFDMVATAARQAR